MPKLLEEDLTALVLIIEQKLDWGEGEYWSGQEFETLREKILADTGQALSVTTLKRVWGKARQENTPSKSTLNILSQFAGFEHWNHFRQEQAGTKTSVTTTFWKLIWIVVALVIILPLLWLFLQRNLSRSPTLGQAEIDQITFSASITTDSFPSTVNFDYDIGTLESDDFQIQTASGRENPINVRRSSGSISETYYYPGYFRAQLLYQGQPVKEQLVQLATDGWRALMNKSSINFPIYLPVEQVLKDSILALRSDNFEALNKSQDYINFRLINLSNEAVLTENNFSFSSIFRLARPFDNSPCKVTTIILHSDMGNIGFGFAIPGCTGDLNFDMLGETISGNTVDLSGFGITPEEWVHLKVINQNGRLSILANGKSLLEYEHQKDIGQIGGVSFVFDGFGEVRKSEFVDLNRQVQLF